MTYADSAPLALEITAACAVVALLTRVLTKDGAVAAFVVGACVSLGFGLPGLAVLGTFFVVGTAATRIGWATKKARGTAEAGEGRRDWKRVLGKGGVAAAFALLTAHVSETKVFWHAAYVGALAAALADTLGTEIGTLSKSAPRALPSLRPVAVGTPGAVSLAGTAAAAAGALAVGAVWRATDSAFDDVPGAVLSVVFVGFAGVTASMIESFAVGAGLRAPGYARNLLTTFAGAAVMLLSFVAIWSIFFSGC